MNIKYKTAIFFKNDIEIILDLLEADLRANYKWQVERVKNCIIWDELTINPKLIRRPTDLINKGKINILELPDNKIEIEIRFSITHLVLLTSSIGLVGVIYGIILNRLNQGNDHGSFIITGGIVLSLILFVGNYLIYKVNIKSALNNSIGRILKEIKN